MNAQRLPSRTDVTGPDESAVALRTGVSITMQRERPDIRAIRKRAIVIEPVAAETRRGIELISFIRPPAVGARRKDVAMHFPVAACLPRIGSRTSIRRASLERRFAKDGV